LVEAIVTCGNDTVSYLSPAVEESAASDVLAVTLVLGVSTTDRGTQDANLALVTLCGIGTHDGREVLEREQGLAVLLENHVLLNHFLSQRNGPPGKGCLVCAIHLDRLRHLDRLSSSTSSMVPTDSYLRT